MHFRSWDNCRADLETALNKGIISSLIISIFIFCFVDFDVG